MCASEVDRKKGPWPIHPEIGRVAEEDVNGGGALDRDAGPHRRIAQVLEGAGRLLADAAGDDAVQAIDRQHGREHHAAAESGVFRELRAGT